MGRHGSRALGWGLHAGVVVGAAVAVRLDRSMRTRVHSPLPAGVPLVIGAYWGALAVAERWRPYRAEWNRDHDDVGADLGFLVTVAPSNLASQALGRSLAQRLPVRLPVGRLPTPAAVALTIVVYDLFHSRLHHLGHVWGPGWRVHAVHHSPRRLYWFNATRFHVIETAIDGFIDGFVAGSMSLSADQEVAYLAVRSLYGQLQHCNVDVDSGVLDFVFSTPDLHRWHHSTDYDEGDTNYGAITSIWDQVFGTFFRPHRPFEGAVGIGRMPEFPRRFGELAAAPFRWSKIRDANQATWFSEGGPADVRRRRRGRRKRVGDPA